MDKKHKDILITKRVELVDNINIQDGLFTQLMARKLFNQRGISKIKTFNTTYEQIEELLNELPRKGPKAFDEFCEALIADDQEEIVRLFLRADENDNNNVPMQPQIPQHPVSTAVPQTATDTTQLSSVTLPSGSVVTQPQTISSVQSSLVTMPTLVLTTSNVIPSEHFVSSQPITMPPLSPQVIHPSILSSQMIHPSVAAPSRTDIQENGQGRMAVCVSNSNTERLSQNYVEPATKMLPNTEDRYNMRHFIIDPNYKGVPLAPPRDVADSGLLPDNEMLRKVALDNLAYSDIRSLFSMAAASSSSPFEKNPEIWRSFPRADSIDAMHKRPYIPNPEYVESAAKRLRSDDTVVLPVHEPKDITWSNPTTVIKNHELDKPSFHPVREFDDPDIDLTDGPVRVQVELSTRQFFLSQYKKSYAMRRIPRGKALIINVNEVEGKPPRRGTDIDRDNLHNLLTQLHFDVTVHNDCNGLSAKEIALKLQDFANLSDHQHADSTIICLLSHGEDGYLFGTDGKKILLDDVFSLFDNKNCKLLIGKPKLFIIQACRGGALDSGVQFPHLDETDGSDVGLKQLPSMSDMLICFPTQNGYYAWRNRERGSWYIEALVHVFMKYAKNEDVCAMLNRVNHLVSRKISRCPQIDMDQMSQMSEYKSTLRMPYLYFFPGIGCG